MKRRSFLQALGIGSATAVASPSLIFDGVSIDDIKKPLGKSKTYLYVLSTRWDISTVTVHPDFEPIINTDLEPGLVFNREGTWVLVTC